MCFVKKGVLKNLANFIGKHLRWSLFIIKQQDFWFTTLLKRDSNTGVFQREHSQTPLFEVQILENEIYPCFLMSKVKKESKEGILKLFYNKRNMMQCKILIQLFPSWKLSSSTPIITRSGW